MERALSLSWMVFATLLLLSTVVTDVHASVMGIDADTGLNVTEMIKRRGYHVEEHQVVTADNYVLTMYRIPRSYAECQSSSPNNTTGNKPAVYLIHGLLDSSYTYVLNFRTQSLAYLLADAGYDVWLGNNRGTTWSRKHVTLSPDDDRFWDFSWEEMAKYDMPAMLNYVLKVSKRPTLSYVGHSEGTMQAFAGFSIDQGLAKKVSYLGALSPVAYIGDLKAKIFNGLAKIHSDELIQELGLNEFSPRTAIIQGFLGKYACAYVSVACDSIINGITGPSKNLNQSRIHVYIAHTPAGTSVKNMVHFGQGVRDKKFRHYDYGCDCEADQSLADCPSTSCKNKAVYGTKTPPAWDLSKMVHPRTAFFTGKNDWLATPLDLAKLRAELPKGTIVAEKEVPFNHLDFTWAYNAREHVYDDMIAQIKRYEGVEY